uniref:NADH dehydrogenase subunit 6 n=1 Tax=Balta curvirostris TaxID=3037034 RepID=UPI00257B24B1|nr:NADH dehydrogenase subunit 6 [Balta curvirostris]WGW15127.1 NADH dehydrogenase subunit 6 [Balta curvirostris]
MKIIMTYMMISSIMFTQMNHPMTMGMMLLIQTILTSMMSGMMSQTFWFPYVLTLIFLGGMMILFIYVTSVSSNEMIFMSYKMIIISFISMIMATAMYMYPDMTNQEMSNITLINMDTTNSLMKLYNNSTNLITIMMATYLFITLIVIVKITNIYKGPLRKIN